MLKFPFPFLQICAENTNDNMPWDGFTSVHGFTVDNRIVDTSAMRKVAITFFAIFHHTVSFFPLLFVSLALCLAHSPSPPLSLSLSLSLSISL